MTPKEQVETLISQYGWEDTLQYIQRGKKAVEYSRVYGKRTREEARELLKAFKEGRLTYGGAKVDMTQDD